MKHEVLIGITEFYSSAGIMFTNIEIAPESIEYAAMTFQLAHHRIIFRLAKITPAKTGQFVTIWKRNADGITAPYAVEDAFDFFIIAVKKDSQAGQFIFPKSILLEQGVISENGKGGKRGMRVYAPWDKTENKQAQKTQQWQQHYFFDYAINKDEAYLEALLK
ncbi:MAG: MepB family protein [Cytophaga sp.]|uniref:MepB family protein n=1 Tax=Cytophaga sp. TaxID=29535 RepID=UPI003F7ED9D0